MLGCDSQAKYRAYKAVVRPLLEYACVVWFPHTMKDFNLLEAVQRRAACSACNSRWDPVTYTRSISKDDCYRKLCSSSCVSDGIICQFILSRIFAIQILSYFQLFVPIIPCPLTAMYLLILLRYLLLMLEDIHFCS